MAKVNVRTKPEPIYTAEGAKAVRIEPEKQLRRSVMACMLWEDSFYEEGESIADRIKELIGKCRPYAVADMAIEARENMKLRHVPLLLIRELARPVHKAHSVVADALERIIQRPDELSEFLAIYWKNGKEKLAAQVKKGLARAFVKFNEYSLAKYNQMDRAVKLRDVLFLCHAKPKDKAQEKLWKRLINNELKVPDTWEVALSAGKDKRKTWERLIKEEKLGALALLRNLRNMESVGVDEDLIRKALVSIKTERVLPFRFISAAKYAVKYEPELEQAMFKCIAGQEKLPGKTVFILDVSGSMNGTLSHRSEMGRIDAAAGLAILAREMCEKTAIYATAGNDGTMVHATSLLPSRRGFALRDAFQKASAELGGGGIFLKQVMDYTYEKEKSADRVIVFTDEQDCDRKCNPANAKRWADKNYLVNISSEKNGIGYGGWIHVDGFSEAILNYILESEREN